MTAQGYPCCAASQFCHRAPAQQAVLLHCSPSPWFALCVAFLRDGLRCRVYDASVAGEASFHRCFGGCSRALVCTAINSLNRMLVCRKCVIQTWPRSRKSQACSRHSARRFVPLHPGAVIWLRFQRRIAALRSRRRMPKRLILWKRLCLVSRQKLHKLGQTGSKYHLMPSCSIRRMDR